VTVQTAEAVPAADLERLALDTVRTLAMDTIHKAGSGHPGTAMALAPAAHVLWTRPIRTGSGSTVTGSCCPTGTRRRCSTRCCT
jgi:Transketolase, thiamine diphosphate binding domain